MASGCRLGKSGRGLEIKGIGYTSDYSRTGIRTPDDDVVLGYFPDGEFSKAVRVALMKLEPFTDYPGTMEIIVKKP